MKTLMLMIGDPRFISVIAGAISGAIVSAPIALYVFRRNREQNYYRGLVELMGDHNWNLLKGKIPTGLPVTDAPLEVAVVCYQHLNLLLYAWLHRGIVSKDGSLSGWKRWADAMIAGANMGGNEQFACAYRDILGHQDLYPEAFIVWLRDELSLAPDKFTARKPTV